MKRLTLAVIVALTAGAMASHPAMARQDSYTTASQAESYTDADLDSLLAPVALYPDTILTHILIASTYPLEVIAADRWRQQHEYLDATEAERAIEDFDWDPSVKALVPFTDILQTLSGDLDWLQALGDNVLISQSRVLARVQVLRQHALNAGTLDDNDYQRIERDRDTIVIAPVRKEIVYVPYYDTRVVYGSWWHPVAPVYWQRPAHYRYTAGFYWSPSIRLSTHFYFGGISWHDRHVIVTQRPVKRFYYGNDIKRTYSRDYQPWQHSVSHRRARYSDSVARTPGKRYVNGSHRVKQKVNYSKVSRHDSAIRKGSVTRKAVYDRQTFPDKRAVITKDKRTVISNDVGKPQVIRKFRREDAPASPAKRQVAPERKPQREVYSRQHNSTPAKPEINQYVQRDRQRSHEPVSRNYRQRNDHTPRHTAKGEKRVRVID